MTDFVRVRLRGTSDRITLYEIAKLTDETERRLNETRSARDDAARRQDLAQGGAGRLARRGRAEGHRVSRPLCRAPEAGRADLRLQQRLPASEAAVLRADGEAAGPPASRSRASSSNAAGTRAASILRLARSWHGRRRSTRRSLGTYADARRHFQEPRPARSDPWREEAGHIWLALGEAPTGGLQGPLGRSSSRSLNSSSASGLASASLFFTSRPCTTSRTASSVIFPDLVRGMSATAMIFAGTCRGEAPARIFDLIAADELLVERHARPRAARRARSARRSRNPGRWRAPPAPPACPRPARRSPPCRSARRRD